MSVSSSIAVDLEKTENLDICFSGDVLSEKWKKKITSNILSLYKSDKLEDLSSLSGAFSFCLSNRATNTFILYRSPSSTVDIFYAYSKDNNFKYDFNFKRLLSSIKETQVDLSGVYFYQLRYALSSSLPIKNMKRLKCGELITFKSNSINSRFPWISAVIPKNKVSKESGLQHFEDTLEEVTDELLEAYADKEVGLYFSGGVDSTILAASLSKKTKLKTFCLSFEEDRYNEASYAKKVSEYLSSEHFVAPLKIDWDTIESAFSNNILPYGHPSIVASSAIANFSKEHADVFISGDGADGYWDASPLYLRLLPIISLAENSSIFSYGLNKLPNNWFKYAERIAELLMAKPLSFDFTDPKSVVTQNLIKKLLLPSVSDHFKLLENANADLEIGLLSDISQIIEFINSTCNIKGDSAAWALLTQNVGQTFVMEKMKATHVKNNIAFSAPFFESKLATLALSLPCQLKQNKQLLKGYITKNITNQEVAGLILRPKHGFGINHRELLARFSSQVADYLSNNNFAEYMNFDKTNYKVMLSELNQCTQKPLTRHKTLNIWGIFALCVWWNTYLKR